MNKTMLCAALLAALSAPVWAVNKCTGADGRVVFQDAPCTGKGGPIEKPRNPAASTLPNVMTPAAIAKELDGQLNATLEKNAEKRSKPSFDRPAEVEPQIPVITPGMTSSEVKDLWGEASSVNETVTAHGKTEQWVYPRGRYETQYVFIYNNVVTSVSTSRH